MEENRKNFECSKCYERFSYKMDFDKHKSECKCEIEKSLECSVCNRTYRHKYFNKHVRLCKRREMIKETKGKRCFTCNICQRSFHLRIALKMHVNCHIHDGEKSLCDKCDKVFPSETVINHICVPVKEIVFPCDECNSCFSSEINVNIHKNRCHAFKKNVICVNCKKEFYTQYHLERHKFQETCFYAGCIERKGTF